MPRTTAAAAGLASSLLLLSATARGEALQVPYAEALRRYAAGDRAGAIAAVGVIPASMLDRQVEALQRAAQRCASCRSILDEVPLKAAVMLHVDRDLAERPTFSGTEQPRGCPGDHARRAGQIASIVAQRDQADDFGRRFFLGMAQRAQWDFCLQAAVKWGRDGLERYPGDPELLLVVGAALEEKATLMDVRSVAWSRDPRRAAAEESVRSGWLLDARRALAETVASAPSLVEGHLRLGRVLWRLGRNDEARAALEEAVRLGGKAHLPFLAHLFLGQVHERAGRAAEAQREFTRALQLAPRSQAAAVALSHARLLAGDAAGAGAALRGALAHSGRRSERDAYWDYPASNAARFEALLDDLREEALR
jgi:tetratricopeptide (TPR) repeat protein